jgi:hypothetical protein
VVDLGSGSGKVSGTFGELMGGESFDFCAVYGGYFVSYLIVVIECWTNKLAT